MDVPLQKSISVRANAKINLTLDITGKRDDGYHFMYMVMQSVSLFDEVSLSLSKCEGIHVSTVGEKEPIEEKTNTAYRAANAFYSALGVSAPGIDIAIKKNIPMMAGMAGGSADAAAVLTGLNIMNGNIFPDAELKVIGAKVGADVPFCLTGGTMLVEGIGEIFTPLPALPECSIVIAKPWDNMRTENSFRLYDEQQYSPEEHPDNEQMFAAIVTGNLEEIATSMYNVLEEYAPKEPVADIKNILLQNGALGACMTGSGTATFGLFDSKSDAKHAFRELSEKYEDVFIVEPTQEGVEVLY